MPASDRDWRQMFPITGDWVYLDHASSGPLPTCNVVARSRMSSQMADRPLGEIGVDKVIEDLRAAAASLTRCEPDQVAFLKCTSEGVDLAPDGLDWRPGDEVILYDADFVGVLAPWLELARRQSVVLRFIADAGRHRFDISDVEALLSPRTRLICVSLVNAANGFRAPVAEIAQLARAHGAWFVVDACQGLGTEPLDVGALGADIVAAHGYKFLLSGFGVAITCLSERALNELSHPQLGWKNAPNGASAGVPVNTAGARRFESSTLSMAGMAGMRESIRLLEDVGLEAIRTQISRLVSRLAEGAAEKGYIVRSSRRLGETSAILSLQPARRDPAEVQQTLQRERVMCAVRDGALRVAPHFYNTAGDIDHFLEVLPT